MRDCRRAGSAHGQGRIHGQPEALCGLSPESYFSFSFRASSLTFGQATGLITGTVHDHTGAVIQGADIVITDVAKGTQLTTVTNADGIYSVGGLGSVAYNVTVSASGFKKFQANKVILQVAEKARVDVTLQVGAVTSEVTVEGTTVAQVETQSSDLAGVVTGKEITQLELNGRNFVQLATLIPGVNNQSGQDEGTVGVNGNIAFSMNGGRTEYNNWELDGGDNMDNGSNVTLNVYPSIDAIAEFRVLTSNYGAQYGRNGSGTVQVETKSGSNAFHGSGYEFVRNDAFNARNYFEQTVPAYKKNDFGYTLGGPVYIPGLYNASKEKTFSSGRRSGGATGCPARCSIFWFLRISSGWATSATSVRIPRQIPGWTVRKTQSRGITSRTP